MLLLRPHHLLCFQAFRGKGYSPTFVSAMKNTIKNLQNNPKQLIFLSPTFDNICAFCPRKNDLCKENHSVIQMDKKVMARFSLSKGPIEYETALKKIFLHFSAHDHHFICASCSWYKQGFCHKELLAFAHSFQQVSNS